MRAMFLTIDGIVVDYDLDVLVELLRVVDGQIDRVEGEISECPDPDSLGLFDRMEGVVGLGFVACQQYVNATYPQLVASKERRPDAISKPPMHGGGKSVVEILDAAANFWKHHDEWPHRGEARVRQAIDSIFPSRGDYVLCNVLHGLVRPRAPRLAPVVELLVQWRDGLNTRNA